MELLEIGDNVIALRLAGKLEKSDIERVIAATEAKLKNHEKLGVYVELESFDGISLGALVEDVKFGLSNFKSFSKKAVVSDKKWTEKVMPIFDKLFPSIELKQFQPEQREEAQAWVRS